jgi:8-amino-7-oxononanoate synthase
MTSLDKFLQDRLQTREQEDRLRELMVRENLIDFCSNDYLGLARSQELAQSISRKLENIQPKRNGATGSRLLSGNTKYVEEVENKLAALFKTESTLIFNSGYSANQAVLSSIPQKGDTIFYDELAHACIKDGARLSMASRFSFRHNDLNDLERRIKKATGKIFIAVESIYSMDGDAAPLNELIALSKKYEAYVILDEAHSTGAFGHIGNGLAIAREIHDHIPVRIYTFGKAVGVHGACVCGSKKLINYLINFARPFIYTTALPVHSIASIECAFEYLSSNIHLQQELKRIIELYLLATKDFSNRTVSNSAIQTLIIPGNKNVKLASEKLRQSGLDVRPILSPTVVVGKERLRICLHSFNSEAEILELKSVLKSLNSN